MATANLDLPDGTKVRIDGTPEEINKILSFYGSMTTPRVNAGAGSNTKIGRGQGNSTRKVVRMSGGAMQHIRELISDQFFIEKRSISDLQTKLEEMGHIYPLTHLSTPLRRLVQNRELRRIKEGKNWVYVNS
jgi:hypothetical protein